MNEQENLQTEEQVKKEKKGRKGKIILLLICIALAIGIGLYVGIEKLNSNPKSIYKRAITNTYKLLDNCLKDNLNTSFSLDYLEEAFVLDTTFKLNTNIREFQDLNNYEMNLLLGIDNPNQAFHLSTGLSQGKNQIINVLLSFLDNHAYLQSKELYDKALDLGSVDIDFNLSNFKTNDQIMVDYDNLHTIFSSMKKILISSLDEEKMSITKENINIDSEIIKSQKVTYLLDDENMERTINYIKNEIIKNDELLESLSNVMGVTIEEIKDNLKEEIKLNNYEEIKINLYTKGNKIIAGNIETKEEAIIRFTNLDSEIKIFIGNDDTNIEISYQDEFLELVFSEYGEIISSIKLKAEKEEKLLEINSPKNNAIERVTIQINNIKDKETEWEADFKMNYEIESSNENNNIECEGSFKLSKSEIMIGEFESVDIKELTEEEQEKIKDNLTKILEKLGINDTSNIISPKL